MTITRDLSTPESRAFWRVPEPDPPKSEATRKALAACKRETAKRLDRSWDEDGWDRTSLERLIASLNAEADALDKP